MALDMGGGSSWGWGPSSRLAKEEVEEEKKVVEETITEDFEKYYDKLDSKAKKSNNSILNSYGITVEEDNMSIDEQIKFYIEKGKSFMLHGPSGVGKTRRIEDADPNFVSIVLRNGILPEEVIGKTIFMNDDKKLGGKWSPPAWYVSLCDICEKEPNKNHVLFIDEITNVKPSEQSLVFHLVLNGSIGPNIGQLPKNVVVVAAGNNKEESESAYNMPEPLFRRFEGHITLKPDITSWMIWGAKPQKEHPERFRIHPVVSAFVGAFGKKVFYTGYDADEPPEYAIDPRGWEQISNIIYDNNGKLRMELIQNKVGKEVASAFLAFAKQPRITVDDIVKNKYSDNDIPTTIDAKYALALSLQRVETDNVQKVRKFIAKNLSKELLSTFDCEWVGEDNEKAIFLSKLDDISLTKKEEEKQEKNKNYKITIKEFVDNDALMDILCYSTGEIDKVCRAMGKLGARWKNGAPMKDWKDNIDRESYQNDAIAIINKGTYCVGKHFNNAIQYEYYEVDLNIQEKDIKNKEKNLGK